MERLPSSNTQSPSSMTRSIMSRLGRIMSNGTPALLGPFDEGLPEETDAVRDAVRVKMPGLGEVAGYPAGLDPEKIIEHFFVFAFPQHVLVMGIRVHLLEFSRDNAAGAKDDNVVLFFREHLRDDRPDQLVARDWRCTASAPRRA